MKTLLLQIHKLDYSDKHSVYLVGHAMVAAVFEVNEPGVPQCWALNFINSSNQPVYLTFKDRQDATEAMYQMITDRNAALQLHAGMKPS